MTKRTMARRDVAAVLASTAVFSALDPQALDRLAAAAVVRRYRRGEYLFHVGDPGDSLLVVAEGLVKVTISSPDGSDVVLAAMGPGESLGELAVLDGAPRSASVVAAEATTVFVLGRRELLGTMAAHPAVLDAVLVNLGALVRRLTETTADLVFLDLGGRLAKTLLRLAGTQQAIDAGLTQSDIAAMVGGSRPAVNKALQTLAARGWISIRPHQIVLHDKAALLRRAGGDDEPLPPGHVTDSTTGMSSG